jgi:putative membrane protein
MSDRVVVAPKVPADAGTELASRRTGMSFQRTRMSADRTLMAVMRTSLSLIGFGFTIFQMFKKLYDAQVLKNNLAPRRFGEALVWMGIFMLVLGIGYHLAFMRSLRKEREQLTAEGLVHADSHFPVSMTLIIATLLLILGVLAIISMTTNLGPFD